MGSLLIRVKSLLRNQQFWLWFFTSLSLLFLANYIYFVFIAALAKGTYFDGFAADGPFQLYNPLRRLADGQLPGRDFPFFHGIGVPILHYLPFELLGKNVFASEVSRWVVSPLLFLITTFLFFWAALRSWKKAIIGTSLGLIFALKYIDVIYPSNSLIGIRTAFPMLVAAALIWQNNTQLRFRSLSIRLTHLLAITALALSFLCGTEQGVAAIIAYLGLRLFILVRTNKMSAAITQLLLEISILGILLFIFFFIATGGHPAKALHYALMDVPQEQSWYFGSPPNSFLTWNNLIPAMTTKAMMYVYAIIIPAVAIFVLSAKRKILPKNYLLAFAFLLIYGLLTCASMLGYFAPTGQLIPVMRGALLITIAFILFVVFNPDIWRQFKNTNPKNLRSFSAACLWFSLPVFGTLVLTTLSMDIWTTFKTNQSFSRENIVNAAKHDRISGDYAAADPLWRYRLDSFNEYIRPGADIWSTYSNLYESNAGITHPSSGGFDYIIHALGEKNREAYEQQFIDKTPEYVITLKPSYFPYEEWLWSKTPRFYGQLFKNYTIISENGSHYLWKYTPRSNASKATAAVKSKNSYTLPVNTSSNVKLYEITVEYKATAGTPFSKLDSLPRYLIYPKNTSLQYAVSLPSYENEWTFLIPVEPGQSHPSLEPKAEGLVPSANLNIKSVRYYEVKTMPQNIRVFENNYCNAISTKRTDYCKRLKTDPLPQEEIKKPINARVPD